MRRRAVAVAALALALGACGGDGGAAAPEDCGLPTPDAAARPELVPAELLLEGTEVLVAEEHDNGINVALGAPWGVQDALMRYRDAVGAADLEIVSEDNEGFEAEIYLQSKKELAFAQIRRSLCGDRSIVFFRTSRVDEGE